MTTTTGPRVRVLRGLDPADATATRADLGTVRARSARDLVVDPGLVRDATEEGYRAGYDAGFSAGLADAAEAIDSRERARGEQIRALLAELHGTAQELATDHQAIVVDMEARIVDMACTIAMELVGHELRHTDDAARDALTRALRLAPENGAVVARLHPNDIATAGELTDVVLNRTLTVVPDTSLRPGDCIVDIDNTRIDARIAPALERVSELLAGGTE